MGAFDRFIEASARNYKVSPEYLRKLIYYESKNDPNAISKAGAMGLGQIMPDTARGLNLSRQGAFDPGQSIDATARLARNNRDQFTKIMGREPTDDELYLTHLQGVAGATRGLRNPNRPAAELWPEAIRFNLPPEAKGQINTITAKEYQDLHLSKFNRAPKGSIDITDQPSLKTLNPPTINKENKGDKQPVIPLSQLAPTEVENNMARYPGYDEAIKQAITGGRQGQVQLAGAIPAGTATRVIKKAPKTPANEAVRKAAEDEAAGVGARKDTPGAARQMEGTYEDYVKAEKARMAAEKAAQEKRAQELKSVPNADEQIGAPAYPGSNAPITPKGVKTERITGPGTAARTMAPAAGAAGVGAAAAAASGGTGDPAVQAVQQAINGPGADPTLAAQNDPASQAALAARMRGGRGSAAAPPPEAVGPRRESPGASVQSEASPPAMGNILSKALPILKQVMSDPETRPAAQKIIQKVVQSEAQKAGAAADMRNDPTYYQQMAARGQMPGGMQDDRAMERAVMMDNAARASSARGVPAVPQQAQLPQRGRPKVPTQQVAQAKDQTQVPVENQIVQQALAQEKGDQPPTPVPAGYPNVPPLPPRYNNNLPPGQPITPAMRDPTIGANIPQPNAPPPPMDPVQQMIMQFYQQGGNPGLQP